MTETHKSARKVEKKNQQQQQRNILDLSKIDIAQSQEEWVHSLVFGFSKNIRLEHQGEGGACVCMCDLAMHVNGLYIRSMLSIYKHTKAYRAT